jgi:hypothetical protein
MKGNTCPDWQFHCTGTQAKKAPLTSFRSKAGTLRTAWGTNENKNQFFIKNIRIIINPWRSPLFLPHLICGKKNKSSGYF